MVGMAGALRAIALLCYMSVVIADKPHQRRQYKNYPRQFSFSNSSSIPPTSFSSSPPSSSSSVSSTSTFSIPLSSSSSVSPRSSPSSSPGSSPGSSFTSSSTSSSSVPTITSTQGTTTSTTAVVITVDWTSVSASTTTSVASATHNSNGWPIIPIHNCWFCLPGGNDGGGIIIAGVTGPGIIPPPPPNVASSLGFSSNIPSITLDADGDPSYPSTEPTMSPSPSSSPSPTTMSTMSTMTRSSSSSSECTSTTTGYDYYVTCTATATDPLLLTTSTGCVTSTVTTTGCDITSTTSTTTVAACPLSVFQSVSSADDAQAASAITVVSSTTIPLAFYVDDTTTPEGFTVSYFGSIFTSNSTSAAPTPTPTPTTSSPAISTSEIPSTSTSEIPSTSTLDISTSSGSDTPVTSSSAIPTSSSSDTSATSQLSTSPAPSSSTSPTSSSPISTTSAAPTPTATWYLTAYDVDCDSLDSSSDFSYYTLQGYSAQSPNEQCSNIQSGLPLNSDTSDSCDWFTNGGFNGPNECSQGTFTKPKSFVIRSGFCTIYEDTDCQGGMNGVTSTEYSGCMNVDDAFVDFNWNSISCFAIG
ncbi:hypothetical protein GGR51DRAFT_308907 [Nemania sp. FL0031]|nr:hypothetical protein GGR51DRAFT_308907 [Nemania sp. FL0031]